MNLKKLIKIIAGILTITLLLYFLLWWPSKAMQAETTDCETEQAEEQPTAEALEVIQELRQDPSLAESYKIETESFEIESESYENETKSYEIETEADELREADEPYENVPEHECKYYYAGYCEGEGELWCCEVCMDSIMQPCSHRHTYCVDCGTEIK